MDWKGIKENVLLKRGSLNSKNIDAVMLKVMVGEKKFDAALSYASYLKLSSDDLSLGAINGLLNFYYEYSKENDLSKSEKEFILKTYDQLYNKYKVLDYTTCDKLLHALCAINEWKKCKRLLSDIHLSSIPTHSAYSTLIATLFKNNNKAEAMKFIQISLNDKRPLQDIAYDEWIRYIFRKYKDKNTMLKYLNEICLHISNNCEVVSLTTATRLKEAFEELKWIGRFTQIRKQSGHCECCNLKLDCIKLSEDEFATLQRVVKEKLILGKDLFLKTSPEELKRFTNFVEKTAPYDIVLDALNIAYTAGKGDVNERIKILNLVVNHFLDQNKKILFLGRRHMLNWKGGTLMHTVKKVYSFFTENISQDDPYFITAAILSGPETDIVSRDLLRGHRFLLQQENLQRLFQMWQWQHQWMVFVPRHKAIIQAPLTFTPCAQNHDNSWHLPYQAENILNTGQLNDGTPDCKNWLCLRAKK
ncbi:unnamed protein product [Danaus chrysippus]|uniref:Mitochondrial ribonuclease P catalytic subunit n=1 Tax=Danaus chrysippus TaxID=151541 RepID=A0A8J2R9M9_9NEOP|nr:unnamed protein product [Danaus chrysippus]